MAIDEEYFEIISCVEDELKIFDQYFKIRLLNDIPLKFDGIIKSYFSKKGKRIRPALIFLVLKAMNEEVCEQHYLNALAVEMIHNATLLHDDIIDESTARHSMPSLNVQYDPKLAVLAGDYLLSIALSALSELKSAEVTEIYTRSISSLINGEISQYFEKEENVSIEQYISKSQNKTAELFKAGLLSALFFTKKFHNEKNIEDFALNFGTAFQIYNDLNGIDEDMKNGINTAPILYYKEFSQDILTAEKIKNSPAIEKTHDLINYYRNKAIENISFLEDNQYKKAIIELCKII